MGSENIFVSLFRKLGVEPTPERIKAAEARKGKGAEKAAKAVIKNEKERERRQRNRKALKQYGISNSIISKNRLDTKNFDKYSKKELQKYKRQTSTQRREHEKAERLRQAGYTDFKKSDLRKSWDKLKAQFPKLEPPEDKIVKLPDVWLYVGYADTTGNGFDAYLYNGYTILELESEIEEFYGYAKEHPDDSVQFHGVFYIDYGTEQAMKKRAEVNYSRGYNFSRKYTKLDDKSYSKLTVSNKWTKLDFLQLVATCFAHMKSSDILHYIHVFKDYCNACKFDYLNFIKD